MDIKLYYKSQSDPNILMWKSQKMSEWRIVTKIVTMAEPPIFFVLQFC